MDRRGVGDNYSDQKFNDFSNAMAKELLTKISIDGDVSIRNIAIKDSEAFTKFGPNGQIEAKDWPGAYIDNLGLGGDWVEARDLSLKEYLDMGSAAFKGLTEAIENYTENLTNWAENAAMQQAEGLAAISKALGLTPDPLVKTTKYVDPIILDLDGNGIQITSLHDGVQFDANGDMIKTGTAWAGENDGLLVLDRNQNGLIDSGQELFGDETILANGKKALHGFEALAELDIGSLQKILTTIETEEGQVIVEEEKVLGAADGFFDKNDLAFDDVRIWMDENQDGISQTNELKTLEELNIQSIQIDSDQVNINYNDAIMVQNSTFTRTDGSIGQAGSFILAQNNFDRTFIPIEVSQEAKSVINISGSGWVRDFQEAVTQSPELINYYQQIKSSITSSEFEHSVSRLLSEWGNRSNYNSAGDMALTSGYGLILSEPTDDQEKGWMDIAIKANQTDRDTFRATLDDANLEKFDSMRERMVGDLDRLYAYEAFTGHTFLNWYQIQSDALHYEARVIENSGGRPIEVMVPLSQLIHETQNGFLSSQEGYIHVNIPLAHLQMLWDRLVTDAVSNLKVPLRLSKYIELVDIDFGFDKTEADFSNLNQALALLKNTNSYEATLLFLEFYKNYGKVLNDFGWNGHELLLENINLSTVDINVKNAFIQLGYLFDEADSFSNQSEIFVGDDLSNQYFGSMFDDIISGQDGQDDLNGHLGNDIIYGGQGNDVLQGEDGDDILVGGQGNDNLNGGMGNDVYFFSLGDGQDIINSSEYNLEKRDKIIFSKDILPENVQLIRQDDGLLVKYSDNDHIIINSFFDIDGETPNRIDQIRFSDGVTWNIGKIKSKVLLATDNNDIIQGYKSNDSLNGLNGDDTIYGNWGDDRIWGNEGKDRLEGGEGNDQLYGGSGNDSLNGGIGNDILNANEGDDLLLGGEGSDTYRFDLGWGSDVIQHENENENDVDTIEFVGIDSNDLIIRKVGQDMQITHRVTGDQLLIQSQFNEYSNVKPIQIIRFDDNTQWNVDEINIQAVKGTELGDVIEGVTDHDVIHAGDGDDVIRGSHVYSQNPEAQYFVYGEAGNDIINGSGYLDGGLGNDNITGLGHLLGGDGNDTLTGQGVLEGQTGDDSLSGQGVLSGGDGDDQLDLTGIGSDAGYVLGGTGNDTITVDVDQKIFVNVNNANDFMQDADGYHVIQESETPESEQAVYIDGGQGNDTIYGSFGNEVYLFNLGDGQDTIIERRPGENFNNVAVSFDVLRLGEEIATADISLHRHGSDLVIQHANNTDQITVQNYFTGGHHKINQIQFSDLTVWDNSYIENHHTYHGTVSNDEVWGYRNSHETFEMGAGDDKVYSGSGNDIIHGQAGNDVLWGQLGNDTLYGGLGADYIEGNEGADILHGDQDNDTLYGGAGDDLIYGNEGSDILRGHSGVDTLDGGAGDDKYFYYLTDGPDVIDQTGGGVDVLWLMDNGITRDRIQFTKDENDLIVTIDNNANQSIRIVDHFLGGEKAISAVQPNNGYTISKAEINALFASEIEEPNPPIEGGIYDTSANDTLVGGAEDNVFFYTAGKDTIQDAGGIDILRFSNGITFNQVGSGLMKTGNDLVLKVNGSTTNQVTLKNYFLAGDHLIETIDFETGGQLTAEQIFNAFGVTLPETEEETGSTDVVGDTTYQYTTGELTITEQSGTDKVIFKNGIDFSQVSSYLNKSGNDLILKVDGSDTNKVIVKNFFLAGQYLVESFQFETGGQLSAEQIFGAFGITMPTTEPENPTEPESPNVVGNTTYDYTTGALTITEQSGNDKVVFKNGIGFSQVANYLTMSGDDLILKVDGSNTNKVTVKNFFLAGEYLVETFQFETGGQITAEQIFGAFGLTVPEQNNPETTQPETGLEAMNSTYTYTLGTLQIDEDYGVDEIVFSNGITFNQVASSLMMSGDDLVLKIDGSNTDKVTIKNFFLGGAHEVESLSFETGGSISSSQIYQAFGLDRPLNAEDEVNAVVLGDTGDNTLMSDVAVSELFILDQGQDIIQLLQNASGETARDYVSDFSLVDDKIDLSAVFVNSQVNNSNLDDYLQVFYDADAKTNTLSVRTSVNSAHKDMLIFTNQAEQLHVDDLLLNQSIMY